jgi:prepilin signal peptidase PulO-like enzyme (type II secretory pathway)
MSVHPSWRFGYLGGAAAAGAVWLLLVVLASDLRERAVYPAIVYPGIFLITVTAPIFGRSVVDVLLGAGACAALFAVLYLFARLRYGLGALGDGDISAAALLGAMVGLSRLSLALALVSVIGAGIALAVALRARSLRATFPYAPALCLAALLTMLLNAP